MILLTGSELYQIHGGKIKLHFDPITAVIAVVGGFIVGGPVGAGMAFGTVIATQGVKNLEGMYHEEFHKPNHRPLYEAQPREFGSGR